MRKGSFSLGLVGLFALILPLGALAQAEPKGPAEVFQRAQEARDAPRLPADHPPIPSDHPPVPPAAKARDAGEVEVSEESVREALIGVELAKA